MNQVCVYADVEWLRNDALQAGNGWGGSRESHETICMGIRHADQRIESGPGNSYERFYQSAMYK